MGQPRFVARQLGQWLYQKQIFSFDEMTNVSKKVRELLSERYELGRSKPVRLWLMGAPWRACISPMATGLRYASVRRWAARWDAASA